MREVIEGAEQFAANHPTDYGAFRGWSEGQSPEHRQIFLALWETAAERRRAQVPNSARPRLFEVSPELQHLLRILGRGRWEDPL